MQLFTNIAFSMWLFLTISACSDDIESLQEQIGDMQNSIADMQRQQGEMMLRLETFITKLVQIEEKMETNLETKESSVVAAFSVYMSESITSDGYTVLPFDSVIENFGENFDINTYKFTCPVDGLYFFTFSLDSGYLQYGTDYYRSNNVLVKDGSALVYSHLKTEITDHYLKTRVGSSVVTSCNSGSQVWVQTDSSTNNQVGGSSNQHTIFSGFLL